MALTATQQAAISSALNTIKTDVIPKIQDYATEQSDANLNALIFGTISAVIDIVSAIIAPPANP
jgi:hypothetical protein